jgi:hypothetical protein
MLTMTDYNDPKTFFKMYLQRSRDALLWKLDGLSERAVRMPATKTGTNLLGIIKHVANVEIGYFGPPFGRTWPTPAELVSDEAWNGDPNADFYANETESAEGIVDLYRRAWVFCDATIDELPLETVGHVPWWPAERADTSLARVTLHVITDLARHAGHADIVREEIDGATGMLPANSNVPDEVDWPAYVTKLTALAERFPA